MKKLNNNGFTLVELLAVLVILITIMSIAIPTISSSLERSKDSQNKQKQKLLESAAELYVADHKNSLNGKKCVKLRVLQKEGYVDTDAVKDVDDNSFRGCILFPNETDSKYRFSPSSSCVDCVE